MRMFWETFFRGHHNDNDDDDDDDTTTTTTPTTTTTTTTTNTAVISIVPYLTEKGEHTAPYKINDNVYIVII